MSFSAPQAVGRVALGLTREELAAAANVGVRTLTGFERGAREPIAAPRIAVRAGPSGPWVGDLGNEGTGSQERLWEA
jgi:hypothetical protein